MRGPRWRAALTIVLGLALAPVVYEGATVCACRWRSMYGQVAGVETPVLDAIGSTAQEFARGMQSAATRAFRNVPWRPAVVIPIGVAWAGVGISLLRRR